MALRGNAKAQLDRVRHLTIKLPTQAFLSLAEHRVIVDRFIARDRVGALEAMRDAFARRVWLH